MSKAKLLNNSISLVSQRRLRELLKIYAMHFVLCSKRARTKLRTKTLNFGLNMGTDLAAATCFGFKLVLPWMSVHEKGLGDGVGGFSAGGGVGGSICR